MLCDWRLEHDGQDLDLLGMGLDEAPDYVYDLVRKIYAQYTQALSYIKHLTFLENLFIVL